MKRVRSALCGLLCAAMTVTVVYPVGAVDMTASGGESQLKINGVADVAAEQAYILTVLKDDYDGVWTDEGVGDLVVAMSQGKTQIDGTFSAELPLHSTVPSGNYYIQLSLEGSGVVDKTITCYYLSKTESEEILSLINKASTADEIKTAVEQYHTVLNISFDGLYASLKNPSRVYDMMLACKKKMTYASTADIQKNFEESCVLERVYECSTASEAVNCIKTNNVYIKADLSELNQLSDANAAGELMLKKPFDNMTDFIDALYEAVGVAAFNTGIRDEMESLLKKYEDKITLPSAYALAPNTKKLGLYKELEKKKNFKSYKEISNFISAWFSSSESGSGSSGSSGGSSGGSGGVSLGVGIVNRDGQNEITAVSSPLTPGTQFTDLKDAAWATEAVEYLVNLKIVNGVSETAFEPNRNITREEFVKLLVEAFDIKGSGTEKSFADVDNRQWYAPYIYTAVENGIINGMDDNIFGVNAVLSRQDMATMLQRTLNRAEISIEKTVELPTFEDISTVADYALEAVQMLCEGGIMNGVSETEFAPKEYATRAMAAKVIYLLIKDMPR